MKAGLYDPYFDTLGGGEKYLLDVGSCLTNEYDVSIFWDDASILRQAEWRFGYDFGRIELTENIFRKKDILKKLRVTEKYDLIIYLSDGSIPFLSGKKNFLLFQHPVNWVKGKNLLSKLKFRNIHGILCYSKFVKQYLDKTFPIPASVLPPSIRPIGVEKISQENIILSVGRFTGGMNTKKQAFLIDIFKKHYKTKFKEWKLVVIGSSLESDSDFVKELRSLSFGYPISILDSISHAELVRNYKKAKIYWHAAGYGEDLIKHPERAEHFGITTVEAMSAGVVPVVINAGGQPEIVENNKSGLLWETSDELVGFTEELINDKQLLQRMSAASIERATYYGKKNFCKKLRVIIS